GAAPPVAHVDAQGDPLPGDAIARLGTARFRLSGEHFPVVALSPDGKRIAAVKRRGGRERIALIDATTGLEIRSFPAEIRHSLEFSGDGKELISTYHESTVRVYDLAQGKLSRQIKVEPANGGELAMSTDGSILASIRSHYQQDSGIVICDARTGKQLARVKTI